MDSFYYINTSCLNSKLNFYLLTLFHSTRSNMWKLKSRGHSFPRLTLERVKWDVSPNILKCLRIESLGTSSNNWTLQGYSLFPKGLKFWWLVKCLKSNQYVWLTHKLHSPRFEMAILVEFPLVFLQTLRQSEQLDIWWHWLPSTTHFLGPPNLKILKIWRP